MLIIIFVKFRQDEGVYVNTNGELVRHAVLQWGETPYAIGKFVTYTIVLSCDLERLNDTYFCRTVTIVSISFACNLCY